MTVLGYRHAAYDSPWWANANTSSGRFNRAGQGVAQYVCLHTLGPAAEMLRHNVGPGGIPDSDSVLLNLWAMEIDLDGVVTLDFDDCDAYGIAPGELIGDDHEPTRDLADTLREQGVTGIRYPSAALPGTHNVVLFGPRLLHPYLFEPVIPEEVRTGHLTDGARPPLEAVQHVRWIGCTHSALDEWTQQGVYALLDDPAALRW